MNIRWWGAGFVVALFFFVWISMLVPTELDGLIPDPALADAIREECGLEGGAEITIEDLSTLRFLRASGRGIRSIEGLEHCSSLLLLELSNNPFGDITPLEGLTSLRTLMLDYTYVTDISPLENLNKLEVLFLSRTGIRDVTAISGLTTLQELHLGLNEIHDIGPLSALTSLKEIQLSSNYIADVSPLAACTSLRELRLSYNRIESIDALSSLTGLERLSISGNTVSSIEVVASMPSLWLLEASSNNITDITPITACTSLRSATLSNNAIGDLSPLLNFNSTGADIVLGNNPFPMWQLDVLAPHLNNYNISLDQYFTMTQPGGYPFIVYNYLHAAPRDYSHYFYRWIRQTFMAAAVSPTSNHVHLVSPLWYVDLQKQWIVPFYCYYHIGGPQLMQTAPIQPYEPEGGLPLQSILPLFPCTFGALLIVRSGSMIRRCTQKPRLYALVLLAAIILGSGIADGASSEVPVGSLIPQPLLSTAVERAGYSCASDLTPEYVLLSEALSSTHMNAYYVQSAPWLCDGITIEEAKELLEFLQLCERDDSFGALVRTHPAYTDGIMNEDDLSLLYAAYEASHIEGRYWAAQLVGVPADKLPALASLLEGAYGTTEREFVACVGNNVNVLSFGYHDDGIITDDELASCTDEDNDGLTLREETLLGTDPLKADTDKDGIPDGCEVYPFSIRGERYDLTAYGVDPLHMDILLATVECPLWNQAPPESYAPVVAAFAGAPVPNPDGTCGIAIRICPPVPGARIQIVLPASPEPMAAWGQCPGRLQWYDVEAISAYATSHHIHLSAHWSYLMMHELGHNVLGELDEGNRSVYGDTSHSRYVGYSMFMGPTGDEGGGNGTATDFHSQVWAEIGRDGLLGAGITEYRLEGANNN